VSTSVIRCPNCGSVEVRSTKPDEYECTHCTARFVFIRPDVQKTDLVEHNCPCCGKPVEAGKGFRCVSCGKYDLCGDCVDIYGGSYNCRECLTKAGKECKICGKLAIHYCGSCQKMYEKKQIPLNDVIRTCHNHFKEVGLFTTIDIVRDGKRVLGTKNFYYYCPRCGEICYSCAEEKKSLFGSSKVCKNCGSKVDMREPY
jgi:hypothetical protein